jgi:hypothetical protein
MACRALKRCQYKKVKNGVFLVFLLTFTVSKQQNYSKTINEAFLSVL